MLYVDRRTTEAEVEMHTAEFKCKDHKNVFSLLIRFFGSFFLNGIRYS